MSPENYLLWYRNVLTIRNNTYYSTAVYNHILRINSTLVKKKSGGRRTLSVLFFVLNDRDEIFQSHGGPQSSYNR